MAQADDDPERALPPALLTDLAGLVARPVEDAFLLLPTLLLLLVDLAGLDGRAAFLLLLPLLLFLDLLLVVDLAGLVARAAALLLLLLLLMGLAGALPVALPGGGLLGSMRTPLLERAGLVARAEPATEEGAEGFFLLGFFFFPFALRTGVVGLVSSQAPALRNS